MKKQSYAVKPQKGLHGRKRSALSRSVDSSNGVPLVAASIAAANLKDSLRRNVFSAIGKRTIKQQNIWKAV